MLQETPCAPTFRSGDPSCPSSSSRGGSA
jgi:hypothetical protein